jgi:aminoglycoside phosphotransferase (APT) family kinase protein
VPDVPPLDPINARSALAEAASAAGLDPAGADLIRLGENAVFRLREPVIARVARSKERLADAEREVRVAQWLAEVGVPAIRPLAVPQPIEARGRVITLWESASDEAEYGSTSELGAILRQLHSLQAPPDLALPHLAVFDRSVARINTVAGISDDDRTFLRYRAKHLAAAYDQLTFDLPAGVIHGDANVGNLLRARDGGALLMDLDGFATGPREWDLIQTAIFYDRFGWHTQSEYREFVAAYGYDIINWPGYQVLRDTRELSMVSWLMQNVASDDKAATEFAKRVHALRTGGPVDDWTPL